MSASTIERPDARHETPNRPRTDDLIRTYAGQEVPAVGPWIIGRGQRVTLVRRGLRHRSIEAIVLDGTYTVTEDPAQSSLDLTLTFPGTVDLVKVSSGSAPSIDIGYNGVFGQRGRPPSMWLVVRAALDRSGVPQLPGRGVVTMHAELNLNPLASLSAEIVGQTNEVSATRAAKV